MANIMRESLRIEAENILGDPKGDGRSLYGEKYLNSALRRVAIDAPVAAGLLPSAMVTTAILGSLVVLQDGWPPIVDVGKYVRGDGGRIHLYKIRTMEVGAQDREKEFLLSIGAASLAEAKASSADDRITPLGRIIRPLSFDELPQAFNLMFGHITTIGPRYPSVTDIEWLSVNAQTEPCRTFLGNINRGLKFGITGIGVVLARNGTDLTERIELENWYVDRANLGADLRILIGTFRELVNRTGK